jgi:hypothetical protein
MFTPRVSPIYRNLATSYLLVDALLDDLCLGSFSGIVEISLRDADYRVILGRGQVLSIADGAGEDCGQVLIAELASRGRKERGLVSIYRCSDEAAWAVTGRIKSKALYNRLSTEFADLEKMISKLQRETDREWFVEVETEAGLSGLVCINNAGVYSLSSSGEAAEGEGALGRLLEQCREAGGTFSVFYRSPADAARVEAPSERAEQPGVERITAVELPARVDIPATRQLSPELQAEYFATAAAESISRMAPAGGSASVDGHALSPESGSQAAPWMERESPGSVGLRESEPGEAERHEQQLVASVRAAQGSSGTDQHAAADPGDISTIVAIGFDGASRDAEAMPEVKRLMAEIASTIERTAREIEPRDTFSIYLRAGQLKIADRYPFLDPFGSEFEYHAGEIAFIGAEGPAAFVQGLTEALQLAVRSVVEASSQPERLRSRIQENLQEMTERLRAELQSFGLDRAIQEITA